MFENYWYIIGFDSEIPKDSMKPVKILNRFLLILRDDQGKISIIEDRCCHRNVQLSLGEFSDNIVTCAYHGWSYDCSGTCVNIPSSEGPIPKTAKISQFPHRIIHDLIWVFIGEPSKASVTPIPELPEMENQPYIYTAHDFEADIKFVSESLFDPYHINHVHKDSIKKFMGDLNEKPVDFNIKRDGEKLTGFYERKNNGTYFDKSYFGFTDFIKTEFEFVFPNISKLKIYFEKRVLTIYEHMVEIEPGRVDMIQLTVWDNIFKPFPWFAKWFMKRISNKIVSEDIAFFKSHHELKKSQNFKDVHVKADEASIEFRRLWEAKEKEYA